MVTITLLGRDWEIAPYKLGAMISAAPFVDAQQERMAEIMHRTGLQIVGTETPEDVARISSLIVQKMTKAEMMLTMKDALGVLHVGIVKIDPSVTMDQLLDEVDPTAGAYAQLLTAMTAVLGAGGLISGEEPAPVAVEELPVDSSAAS